MGCGVVSRFAEAHGGITPGVNVLEDISQNFAGAGVKLKITPLKAGFTVVQHKHKYPHLSVLVSGEVLLWRDSTGLAQRLIGPISLVIGADELHAVEAVKDSVWICAHDEREEVI